MQPALYMVLKHYCVSLHPHSLSAHCLANATHVRPNVLPESSELWRLLRYDCDVTMGMLHHIASRRLLHVPSQRARHAFFAAGVESQVSIDAFTTVCSTHGPSTGRFWKPILARAPTTSMGPLPYCLHVSAFAGDKPSGAQAGSAHHESWLLHVQLRS